MYMYINVLDYKNPKTTFFHNSMIRSYTCVCIVELSNRFSLFVGFGLLLLFQRIPVRRQGETLKEKHLEQLQLWLVSGTQLPESHWSWNYHLSRQVLQKWKVLSFRARQASQRLSDFRCRWMCPSLSKSVHNRGDWIKDYSCHLSFEGGARIPAIETLSGCSRKLFFVLTFLFLIKFYRIGQQIVRH